MIDSLPGAWIYVMATSSDYSRFKLGRTGRNPLDRAKQLRTGDPFLALAAAYFVPTARGQLSKIEAAVHGELEGRIRFDDGSPSEWFRGTANWACAWIEGIFEGWCMSVSSGTDRFETGVVVKVYEEDLRVLYGPGIDPPQFDDLPM